MTPKGMIGVIFQIYASDEDEDEEDDEGNTVEVRRGKVRR